MTGISWTPGGLIQQYFIPRTVRKYQTTKSFSEGLGPQRQSIFILRGTGIFFVLFYKHPVLPTCCLKGATKILAYLKEIIILLGPTYSHQIAWENVENNIADSLMHIKKKDFWNLWITSYRVLKSTNNIEYWLQKKESLKVDVPNLLFAERIDLTAGRDFLVASPNKQRQSIANYNSTKWAHGK